MRRLNGKTTLLPILALGIIMSFNSCEKSCEESGTCPEFKVIERTDIIITNENDNTHDVDFRSSVEEDYSIDLISYIFNPANPNQLEFIIHFASDNDLSIKVTHENIDNVWEGVDIDYAMYPTQELNDKWKYVMAEFAPKTSDSAAFATNLGEGIPSGPILDVFRITSYNSETQEIQCRIRELTLFKNTEPSKEIYVNGTFTGAVTFL